MFSKNTWRILGGALLVASLALLLVLGLKSLLPKDNFLKAKVSPRVIPMTDSIYFYDSTHFANTYKWLFGDGSFSTARSGTHQYNIPGNYVVTLIVNSQFRDSFFIRVEGTGYTYTEQDSVFKIVGPPAALQGENVMFRVDGYGSDEFVWDFGDHSARMTTSLSVAQHIYKRSGVYEVQLFSRNNNRPYKHKIIISPEYDRVDTTAISLASAAEDRSQEGDDFKSRLQAIIDAGSIDQHYNYLLKKYVCGNANMPVQINGAKTQPFYLYCQNLIFNSSRVIQSVELSFDNRNKCVVSAKITQND